VAADIPTRFPTTVVAGDTVKYQLSLADYPAGDGWTMTTEIVGSSADLGTFTAVASGDDYLTTIAATTTAGWAAGDYSYQIIVTLSSERFTVERGTVTVKPDLATASTLDGRTHAKTVLDAIEALLEGKATKDQASYSIAGRSLARYTFEELLVLRSKYQAEVQAETNADRIAKGLGTSAKIHTRFI